MYQNSKAHKNNLTKARAKIKLVERRCSFCKNFFNTTIGNYKQHRDTCFKRPENKKICPVCNKGFFPKEKIKISITCSCACANTYFRSGINHPNRSEKQYRSTCFEWHKKKCICCSEKNIVEVHHFDHNSKNNDPKNLVPLCPTHHKYVHSRYKKLIYQKIKIYVKKFREKYKHERLLKYYRKT